MKIDLKKIVIALGFLVSFAHCQKAGDLIKKTIETPKVSLEDLALSGISAQKLDLVAKLGIDNPNPIGLNLAGIAYELELAENPFLSGKSDMEMKIAASGKSQVQIPLSLKYEDLNQVYNSLKDQDEVPYRLKGQVKLDTPIGPIPIPYELKGKLPVVRPPRINSVEMKVGSLSLQSAKLELHLKLFNPNAFPLNITEAGYHLKLNGKDFSHGEIGSAEISAKSEGELKIPLTLDLLGMGNWAYNLLKSGTSDYELTYEAKYQIKDWPVKHQDKKSGTLKFKK